MMIGVYLGARLLRESGVLSYKLRCWLLMSLPILLVLAALGFGEYCSPIAFVIATGMFLLFEKIRVPLFVGKTLAFIGPSLFSVYLLHVNAFGFEKINAFESYLLSRGCSLLVVYVVGLFAVFVVTLIMDIPRRIAVMLVRKGGLLLNRKAG